MSNFIFLKPIDKNLFEIITDAEKLYKDEYFDQCIAQTRKFGENICKNVLGNSRTCEKTFDDMLATLKDKVSTVIQEKEFVDDLYFLKREGNTSVHSSTTKKDGIIALECLQRAFEIAISYAVYYKGSSKSILKLQYDTKMLITGKKTKKSLAERYEAEKNKSKNNSYNNKLKKLTKKKSTTNKKQKKYLFKIVLAISAVISLTLIVTIFLFVIAG